MTALIFALIKENFVAEQGARMVSMDGASKNAGDMIDKLNLSFNRMRQAVSTTSFKSETSNTGFFICKIEKFLKFSKLFVWY